MASTKLATANGWIPTSQKGAYDGVATLNQVGFVPFAQLPSRAIGLVASAVTTDATEALWYLFSSARVFALRGLVSARSADDLLNAAWTIQGAAKMDGAGNMVLLGTPTVELLGADAGAAAWGVEMKVVAPNAQLVVAFTGEEDMEVHWAMTLHEVSAHASLDWVTSDGHSV